MQLPKVQSLEPPITSPAAAVAPEQQVEKLEVIHAVRAVNEAQLFGEDSELTFILDRETRKPVTRLVDRKTNEVIRQIPSEAILRLAEQLRRR